MRIHLEAIDPAHNCFRAYSIVVERDLFGCWLVDMTNGRIGSRGTTRRVAGDQVAALLAVRAALKRRASARRRIGVEYRVTEIAGDRSWLV